MTAEWWSALGYHPALPYVLLTWWLLPGALQDYRQRRVSNWLTVPLFLLAWPLALASGHVVLVLAVFAGMYVVYQVGGAGAADGKVAVGLAAVAPLALALGMLLEALAFAVLRLRGRRGAALPGVTWLYLGCVLSALLLGLGIPGRSPGLGCGMPISG